MKVTALVWAMVCAGSGFGQDPFLSGDQPPAANAGDALSASSLDQLKALQAAGDYLGMERFAETGDPSLRPIVREQLESRELLEAGIRQLEALLASRSLPPAELYLKLGDLQHLHSRYKIVSHFGSMDAWERAAAADPNSLAPLERLLREWRIMADAMPHVYAHTKVRDVCVRILSIEEEHGTASVQLHRATVLSAEAGGPITPAQVDESLASLARLAAQRPEDPEAAMALAHGLSSRAQLATRSGDLQKRDADYAKAVETLSAAIERSPRDAQLRRRQADVLRAMAVAYGGDKGAGLRKEAVAAATIAASLLEPTADDYAETYVLLANLQEFANDSLAAERTLRDAVRSRPDDLAARVALATLLSSDPEGSDEAIALLEEPIQDTRAPMGARILLLAASFDHRQALLTALRIDALARAASDPSRSQRLRQEIEQELAAMAKDMPEHAGVIRLQGRYHQANSQFVEAIQLYRRAAEVLQQHQASSDDDMMYQLARCYIAINQTGSAREILVELVERYPTFVPARVQLCRVYLHEGDLEGAEPHLNELRQQAPSDPLLAQLERTAESLRKQRATLTP